LFNNDTQIIAQFTNIPASKNYTLSVVYADNKLASFVKSP